MKNHSAEKKIEAALARDDWDGARKLVLRDLEDEPDNHWLLARLSTTYYEQRRYEPQQPAPGAKPVRDRQEATPRRQARIARATCYPNCA